MYTNPAIEQLRAEFEAGDATAAIPLADELCEAGHPHGEELVEMARHIAIEEDWVVVVYATAIFKQLMEKEQ